MTALMPSSNEGGNPQKRIIVDMAFFKDMTMGDYEFEKDLLTVFKDSGEKNLKRMEDAIKDGDNQSWCISCHAFKGGANSVGAIELAKMLEHGQKNPKENTTEKTQLLNKVKEEFEIVIKFLGGEIERSLMF